jgi:hypothetical protein
MPLITVTATASTSVRKVPDPVGHHLWHDGCGTAPPAQYRQAPAMPLGLSIAATRLAGDGWNNPSHLVLMAFMGIHCRRQSSRVIGIPCSVMKSWVIQTFPAAL